MFNTPPILCHFPQQNLILGLPIWSNSLEQNCLKKPVFNIKSGLNHSFL